MGSERPVEYPHGATSPGVEEGADEEGEEGGKEEEGEGKSEAETVVCDSNDDSSSFSVDVTSIIQRLECHRVSPLHVIG